MNYQRIALSITIGALSVAFIPARAMVVESGKVIVIDSSTTEDIYLAGGTVVINAPLHGDLVVAAGRVYINDSVGNILLAGGTAEVNGIVTGKIRCLAGTLRIGRLIHGDLVAAGGEITIGRNGGVSGDVLASGGTLIIYGKVDGKIRAMTGNFQLFGIAGSDLYCRGGSIDLEGKVMGSSELAASERLTIGTSMEFNGPVRYWSPAGVDFGTSAKNGRPIRDDTLMIRGTRWYFLGTTGLLALLWYLTSSLLVMIVLQYLFGSLLRTAGEKAYDNTLRSLGNGVLFLLGLPVIIALLMISLVGIPLAVALLMGYVGLWLICGSITAIVVSNGFIRRRGMDETFWKKVGVAFGSFILLMMVRSIPVLGWLVFLLLVCVAIGASVSSVRLRRS